MAHRVLVVDDERSTLKLVDYVLGEAGYEVAFALDGRDGIDKLESFLPHLIIADVIMPRMDGLEMCRRVRCEPGFELVPFIFLSARTQIAAQVEGLETGADDYIPKPFDRDELVARVEAVLRRAAVFEQAARIDMLSGLGNREFFEQRLCEELYRESRYGTTSAMALMAIDLDELDELAARHGSAAADAMIRAVGRFLRDNVRALDVPARYCETGFVVLMPHTNAEQARIAVRRLRDLLAAERVSIAGRPHAIEAGFGLEVVGRALMDDVAEMIERAHATMIAARRAKSAVA